VWYRRELAQFSSGDWMLEGNKGCDEKAARSEGTEDEDCEFRTTTDDPTNGPRRE